MVSWGAHRHGEDVDAVSFQDNYSQLPPGLDPSNLARLAQLANQQSAQSRQAQEAELPPDQPPPQQQQQPRQEARAETGDTADDTTADVPDKLPPDTLAPGAPDPLEPPAPTRTASLDPLTGRLKIPQLERRNEPYVPASARSSRAWGTDPWEIAAFGINPSMAYGPFMPAPQEVYGVIRGVGAQMAQWGAPSYGQYYGMASSNAAAIGPMLDALTGGRFTKGFNAARLGSLRIQQEQMKINLQQALQQHRDFLNGASGILDFYTYGGEKGSDVEALETAKTKMRNYLIQTGHQNMINMLDTQGMKGVVDYITYEDQKYVDGLKAHTSLKKATGASDEEKDRAFEGGGGKSADADSRERRLELAGTPGADKEKEELPDAPKTPSLGEEGVDVNAELKKTFPGTTDREIEAARNVLHGEDDPDVGRVKKERILRIKDRIQNETTKAAHAPGTQADKLKRIRNIDPTDADAVEGLLNLNLDPEKDIPSKGSQRQRLTQLATAVNPNWKSNTFKIAEQFSKANGPMVQSVRRVSAFLPAVNSLNSSLLRMDEGEVIPARILEKVYTNNWDGDPAYAEVYTAIQAVLNETAAIQSGTGRPQITNVKMRAQEMLNTMSPAQIRAQLLIDAQTAYGVVRGINNQYKRTVGDPQAQAPWYPKQDEKDYKAILRMNPYTGEVPSDGSGAVRATSKRPVPEAERPSWLGKDRAWKPMTEEQVFQARKLIRENQNSEDPHIQANIQKLRRRLGTFATPDIGDPDYEEAK